MRIAYIYTALTTLGGVDRVLTIKANYLADVLGHEVYVITDSQAGRPPVFPLSERVHHIDLQTDFDEQYHHGILRRYMVYRRLMRQYRQRLEQTLCDVRPDIVSCTLGREMDFLMDIHDGSYKIGESHIAKPYCRNLHLMEERGGLYKLVARLWRARLERAVKRLDALVVLTQRDADSWASVRPATVIHNPCTIVPQGIADVRQSKTVVAVGRMSEQKALDRLVRAWKPIAQHNPDWQLCIYGEGEKQAELELLIAELGLGQSCHLCGTTSDVASVYAGAAIYAMTSRFEGFPLVLIEAMSCGLPVVSMDCPTGAREIVTHGHNGLLVPDGDIEAMSTALQQLIDSPDLRQQLAEVALSSARDRFGMEPVMHQWELLFDGLKLQRGATTFAPRCNKSGIAMLKYPLC